MQKYYSFIEKQRQFDENLSNTELDPPKTQFLGIPASTISLNRMAAHSAYYLIQKQVAAKEEYKNVAYLLRNSQELTITDLGMDQI